MDPNLYRAAMEGKADILLEKRDQLVLQVTPNKNTVLHIAAMSGNTDCVDEILRTCPSLLCKVNYKGETPLHIAARKGNLCIVDALVTYAKSTQTEELESGFVAVQEMLRMTDDDGDTALHHAVRGGEFGVVKMLIQEDAEFSHPLNKAQETPLYLAAERRLEECVSEILKTCTSPSPGGPGGRTALHAAAIFNSQGIMEKLLKWKQDLAKKPDDQYGWTALHYAAHFGHVERVKQLLDLDPSLAYLAADKDDKKTALHIAASRGQIDVMKYLIDYCPDCWEMVNSKGQNIIHIAVENQRMKVMEFIILEQPFHDNLINQKDDNGNTPLHLLAASDKELPAVHLFRHPKAEHMVFNKENKTPLEAYSNKIPEFGPKRSAFQKFGAIGHRNLVNSDKDETKSKVKFRTEFMDVERMKKLADTNLIVATLIATIAFAAGFTLPGGYESNAGPNQGMAVLAKKAAFKAFLISDTLAMVCSSCAVIIYFMVAGIRDMSMLVKHHSVANILLLCGEGAMVLAFITGIYAVLGNSVALAISICVIGCLFFPLVFFVLKSVNNYLRTTGVIFAA